MTMNQRSAAAGSRSKLDNRKASSRLRSDKKDPRQSPNPAADLELARAGDLDALLNLQRTVGNTAVTALLQRAPATAPPAKTGLNPQLLATGKDTAQIVSKVLP